MARRRPQRARARVLDQHRKRVAVALEHRLVDVSEILAIDLERLWPIAPHCEPIAVVEVRHLRRILLTLAAQHEADQAGEVARPDILRRDAAQPVPAIA